MEGMSPPMFEHMPPECMGGFDGPMMHYMPHDCMGAMGPMHMEHMPPEAMAAMPMPPEAYIQHLQDLEPGVTLPVVLMAWLQWAHVGQRVRPNG